MGIRSPVSRHYPAPEIQLRSKQGGGAGDRRCYLSYKRIGQEADIIRRTAVRVLKCHYFILFLFFWCSILMVTLPEVVICGEDKRNLVTSLLGGTGTIRVL